MADFRKWIYTLAVVALLAGFTVPAEALTGLPDTAVLCPKSETLIVTANQNASLRATWSGKLSPADPVAEQNIQGYLELMLDVANCTNQLGEIKGR